MVNKCELCGKVLYHDELPYICDDCLFHKEETKIRKKNMCILYLTIKKEFFDDIREGRKDKEYRRFTLYWYQRLVDKKNLLKMRRFKEIYFRNGRTGNSPFLRTEHLRTSTIYKKFPGEKKASTLYCIHLGEIIEVGNLKKG